MTIIRRFALDRRGSPAVEFAIVAPVIILIFVAVFELGMLEICRNALEVAAREASRMGITGAVPAGFKTREAAIEATVQTIAGPYFSAGSLVVTTDVFKSYSTIYPEPWTDTNHNGTWDAGEAYVDVNANGHWDANPAASGAGGSGDVVRYTITARRPFMTPIWHSLMGGSDAEFQVQILVRNE